MGLLYGKVHHSDKTPGVSVIICAHNEAENLKKNLSFILDQEYNDFEVIVVNDRSNDDTNSILDAYTKKYDKIVQVVIEEKSVDLKGKRNALIQGVKTANKRMLLLTDADCRPASRFWIRNMMNVLNPKTNIILGHAPFYKGNGLRQYLFRFDNAFTAMKYYSAYTLGMPYMGVGRNIAINREFFINNMNLFKTHKTISGDDDLFVNALANKSNTSVCLSSDSFMYSAASVNLEDYIKRKRRHLSAGSYYKRIHLFGLGIIFFNPVILNIIFISFFSLSVIYFESKYLMILSSLFLFKYLIQYLIYNKLFTLFDNKTPLRLFPVLDLFYFLLTLVIIISVKINRNIKWQ
jgi:glycosyltransferase involved in cell wall biosynthesis